MLTEAFSVSRLPRIEFGAGSVGSLPALLAQFGKRMLLVSGSRSLRALPRWQALADALRRTGFSWEEVRVSGEPSPQLVDQAVRDYRAAGIEVVLGIGGGSALDAAKAIAGLLPHGNSVLDHLEGVGRQLPYRGPALPFIAVPTTAGTGSEATRNAVLSVQGSGGFKKSFRHEALVPQYAVVDPDLLASCPPSLIAANGMDALTQLLEAYVSSRASPFTDALAQSGLAAVRDGLLAWYEGGANAAAGRAAMAYAALLSGITLAQAGLGSVHGLASPLGAFFPIPHGVVCGTLVAAATRMNIAVMERTAPSQPALDKYAHAGSLLSGEAGVDAAAARKALVRVLEEWSERMQLPRLGAYGVTAADIGRIVAHSRGSSMQTNPVRLTDEEIGDIVRQRL